MDDQNVLSTLCAICYTEQPKYRCPRCKGQTCSLICYKRHQQRAACNGLRDPTAYKRKNQIATPAGIDHDYNYLKGVERQIEAAADDVLHSYRDASQKGDANSNLVSSSRTAGRARLAGGSLQRYLHDSEITVEYAPAGMSRRRTNLTRSSNRGKILWTVEWVDSKGKALLQHDCSATSFISALHDEFCTEQRRAEKRKASSLASGESTKRRPRQGISDPLLQLKGVGEDQKQLPQQHSEASTAEAIGDQHAEARPPNIDAADEQSAETALADGVILASVQPPEATVNTVEKTDTQPDQLYYLLQPHGKHNTWRGLVPLTGEGESSSLTDNLRGRIVREYPTIYALHSLDDIPSGHTLLDPDYRPAKVDLGPTVERSTRAVPADRTGAMQNHDVQDGHAEPQVDANAILDMLRRDLRA